MVPHLNICINMEFGNFGFFRWWNSSYLRQIIDILWPGKQRHYKSQENISKPPHNYLVEFEIIFLSFFLLFC